SAATIVAALVRAVQNGRSPRPPFLPPLASTRVRQTGMARMRYCCFDKIARKPPVPARANPNTVSRCPLPRYTTPAATSNNPIKAAGWVMEQGGGQPPDAAVAGAVMAGDGHAGGDDPDLDPADQRQDRPVGQVPQDRRAAGGGQPDQELRLGGGDLGQERR